MIPWGKDLDHSRYGNDKIALQRMEDLWIEAGNKMHRLTEIRRGECLTTSICTMVCNPEDHHVSDLYSDTYATRGFNRFEIMDDNWPLEKRKWFPGGLKGEDKKDIVQDKRMEGCLTDEGMVICKGRRHPCFRECAGGFLKWDCEKCMNAGY
jgi:hypothetical protein